MPVWYPACLRRVGNVARPGSMISAASPGRIPVPFLRKAYSPVSIEYREGVQVAADE